MAATLLVVARRATGGRTPNRTTGRIGMAVVRGRSMLPTLRPGDRLLLRYGVPPRPGSVVVGRFADGTVVVKRAAERRPDGWWLLGDADVPEAVDSRHRGAVAEDDVLAVAVARLWPWPRRL